MPNLAISAQESIFSLFDGNSQPPPIQAAILGETFDKKADGERLGSQQRRVEELMLDGEWRSLHEIAVALRKLYGVHFPEASISARLRDLRRAGYTVERERKSAKSGLWLYRTVKMEVAA
jgi:hypothetical protein